MIVHAGNPLCLGFGFGQRRQQHRGENRDDCDHDQQLNQGERAPLALTKRMWLVPCHGGFDARFAKFRAQSSLDLSTCRTGLTCLTFSSLDQCAWPACHACKPNGVHQNTGVRFREKIIPLSELPRWRDKVKSSGKRLVVTNGCFDLLHVGHVSYLEQARQQGDLLLLGLNGDAGVRRLKGVNRPVVPEADRAAVVAALESVDAVCIFPEQTATNFLSVARPDIYVKGGDYTPETLNREERSIIEQAGARIVILPFVPGHSTTEILRKIARL